MDIAVVSAAVNLSIDRKGVIAAARVALGAVAPTAIRVPAAEKVLIGNTLDEATLAALAAACSAACKPIDDKRGTVAYRTRVAGVLAKRAAMSAWTRAGGKS
jgi:carbon-monoxide dehydrogenase medium subunit